MSATLIGTTGTWGIADAETGLIIEALEFDGKDSEKWVKDIHGQDVGGVFYNDEIDISLKGLATSTSPFSGKVSSVLSIANTMPALTQGSSSTGTTIIRGIKQSLAIEDFVKFDISPKYKPYIPSS
jgi:hypothetical protein